MEKWSEGNTSESNETKYLIREIEWNNELKEKELESKILTEISELEGFTVENKIYKWPPTRIDYCQLCNKNNSKFFCSFCGKFVCR